MFVYLNLIISTLSVVKTPVVKIIDVPFVAVKSVPFSNLIPLTNT
jgi:hypothetical protein